jgi:hypothetical protein
MTQLAITVSPEFRAGFTRRLWCLPVLEAIFQYCARTGSLRFSAYSLFDSCGACIFRQATAQLSSSQRFSLLQDELQHLRSSDIIELGVRDYHLNDSHPSIQVHESALPRHNPGLDISTLERAVLNYVKKILRTNVTFDCEKFLTVQVARNLHTSVGACSSEERANILKALSNLCLKGILHRSKKGHYNLSPNINR